MARFRSLVSSFSPFSLFPIASGGAKTREAAMRRAAGPATCFIEPAIFFALFVISSWPYWAAVRRIVVYHMAAASGSRLAEGGAAGGARPHRCVSRLRPLACLPACLPASPPSRLEMRRRRRRELDRLVQIM